MEEEGTWLREQQRSRKGKTPMGKSRKLQKYREIKEIIKSLGVTSVISVKSKTLYVGLTQ